MKSQENQTKDFGYLNEGRIKDVILAIQVIAKWTGEKLRKDLWTEKLGIPYSVNDWTTVFKEHGEFFGVTETHAYLRWRLGLEKTYSPNKKKELSPDELIKHYEDYPSEEYTYEALKSLPEQERKKKKREGVLEARTLTATEIGTLLSTAIDLHERGIAHNQEKRWRTMLYAPLIGGLIGIIIGALLGGIVSYLFSTSN